MSTHTPGPWQWMTQELNDRIAKRLNKPRSKLSKRDGIMLYSLKGPPNGNPDADDSQRDRFDYVTVMEMAWHSVKGSSIINATPSPADKALIAAAPDMLNALKLINSVNPAMGKRWASALEIVQAAIAKAEGKQ